MNKYNYYEDLKKSARNLRAIYGFSSPKITIPDLRRIYREEGIKIDLAPSTKCPFYLGKVKGAYYGADGKIPASVLLNKTLPQGPRLFTMAHELKHHFHDQHLQAVCHDSNKAEIEIGAEIYAAELLLPDDDFLQLVEEYELTAPLTPEDLVILKKETEATMSYQALVKKAAWLKLANLETFVGVKWVEVEESIYGANPWRARARARSLN